MAIHVAFEVVELALKNIEIQLLNEELARRGAEIAVLTRSNYRFEAELEEAYKKLAEQALINDEMRQRLDWYRRLLHQTDIKRDALKAEHRLNGES